MPIAGAVIAAILLLAVCSFCPGFFFVRRLHWTPLEKLCGSVGLSAILVYVAAWAVYCIGPPQQRPVYWVIAAASATLGLLSARDARRLFATFRVRQAALAFVFLLAFTLAMLAVIRVYSGAGWAGDWAEHFQRSLFFLDRLPLATKFIDIYDLPARPPMQNVLAAFYLGLTADRFEVFQAIFGFLNLLMFLPCVLLMPALGFRRSSAVLPLAALFAANPAVMQNVTYSWTKALTAFYVILAIALYLAGWRKNDRVRSAAAFLALAAGVLVHYSAGPYVVVMGLHYLVRVWRERRWSDVGMAVAPALLLLATWFGWSFSAYGTKTTLASNTSVSTAESDPGKNTAKIAANIFDTIVPTWLRGETPAFDQPNAAGRVRDQAFLFYQVNLVFAMGSVGGPLIVWLVYRRLIRGNASPERRFWLTLIPISVILGIAVVGERDPQGVAHLTLLALQLAGLTLLASAYRTLPPALRWLVVAGCCVDFGLGVFLHARVQSLENTSHRTVFAGGAYLGEGRFGPAPKSREALSDFAWRNWFTKRRPEILTNTLRELPRAHAGDPMFRAGWPVIEQQMKAGIAREDASWGGWFGRHGGALEFLGDRVAGQSGTGTDIASALLVALFGGLLWLLIRQPVMPVAVAAARSGIARKPRKSRK